MRLLLKGKPEEFIDATMDTLGFTDGVDKCCYILAAFCVAYLLIGLVAIHKLALN
jgi:hypothetical protein